MVPRLCRMRMCWWRAGGRVGCWSCGCRWWRSAWRRGCRPSSCRVSHPGACVCGLVHRAVHSSGTPSCLVRFCPRFCFSLCMSVPSPPPPPPLHSFSTAVLVALVLSDSSRVFLAAHGACFACNDHALLGSGRIMRVNPKHTFLAQMGAGHCCGHQCQGLNCMHAHYSLAWVTVSALPFAVD